MEPLETVTTIPQAFFKCPIDSSWRHSVANHIRTRGQNTNRLLSVQFFSAIDCVLYVFYLLCTYYMSLYSLAMIFLCVYIYVHLHIYRYICTYITIYTYLKIHIYIYLHTYVYIHIHLMYAVCLTKRNAGVYHVLLERNAKGKQNTAICRICCLLLAKHRCLQFSCRHERKKTRK